MAVKGEDGGAEHTIHSPRQAHESLLYLAASITILASLKGSFNI